MKSPTLESGPNICKMTRVLLESGKLLLVYLLAKWSLPSISLELSVLDQRSFSILQWPNWYSLSLKTGRIFAVLSPSFYAATEKRNRLFLKHFDIINTVVGARKNRNETYLTAHRHTHYTHDPWKYGTRISMVSFFKFHLKTFSI